MKRLIALAMIAGLVGAIVGPTEALARKKRLVPTPVKFFLRDDNGCDDPNYLSREDGPDNGCWQADSFLNEAFITQLKLIERDAIAQHFVARDGVPLILDAKKALTGEISTYSGSCVNSSVPCSPAGLGAGQASIDIIVRGTTGGSEIVLGEHTETFTVVPGGPHTTEVSFELDDALNKKKFDSLRVSVFPHGVAFFHSGVEMENPASFITVPTLVKK